MKGDREIEIPAFLAVHAAQRRLDGRTDVGACKDVCGCPTVVPGLGASV